MNIFFPRQQTLKEVWAETGRLYGKIVSHVWLLAFLVSCIAKVYSFVIVAYPIQADSKLGALNILYLALAAGTLLLSVYLLAVILHRIYVISENKEITYQNTFNFVRTKYFTLVVAMFFSTLLWGLGIVLFVLPGIFLFFLLLMVQPLILFEHNSAFAAIKNSAKLIWGDWWRTLIIFLPLMCLGLLITYLLNLLAKLNYWYAIIANISILTLLYPYFYVCLFIQFKNLKSREQ